MNNLFPPHKDIHETYDLKGSTVGRLWRANNPEADEKAQTETSNSEKERRKEKKKSSPVLKDLNWINGHHKLELGPEKRALLTEQLRVRCEIICERSFLILPKFSSGIKNFLRLFP